MRAIGWTRSWSLFGHPIWPLRDWLLWTGLLATFTSTVAGCHPLGGEATVAIEVASEGEGIAGVSCHDPSYDAGQIPEGGVVQHTFLLTNRSDSPRTIGQIEKNCSCLHAEASTMRLEPGGTSAITVVLTAGEAEKFVGTSVSVHFEGINDALDLHLVARVEPHLRVWPRSLDFGKLGQDETISRSLRIQQDSEESPVVQSITSDTPVVRATLQRVTTQPPYSWEVTALIRGSDVRSEVKSQLRLVRSDGGQITIPLRALPGWGFEIQPATPTLVLTSADARQEFTIRSREGWPFMVTGASLDVPFLHINVPRAETPSDAHQLTLGGDYPGSQGELRGSAEAVVNVTQFLEGRAQQFDLSIPIKYWALVNASENDAKAPTLNQVSK